MRPSQGVGSILVRIPLFAGNKTQFSCPQKWFSDLFYIFSFNVCFKLCSLKVNGNGPLFPKSNRPCSLVPQTNGNPLKCVFTYKPFNYIIGKLVSRPMQRFILFWETMTPFIINYMCIMYAAYELHILRLTDPSFHCHQPDSLRRRTHICMEGHSYLLMSPF